LRVFLVIIFFDLIWARGEAVTTGARESRFQGRVRVLEFSKISETSDPE
jgi:hypothetical protein